MHQRLQTHPITGFGFLVDFVFNSLDAYHTFQYKLNMAKVHIASIPGACSYSRQRHRF